MSSDARADRPPRARRAASRIGQADGGHVGTADRPQSRASQARQRAPTAMSSAGQRRRASGRSRRAAAACAPRAGRRRRRAGRRRSRRRSRRVLLDVLAGVVQRGRRRDGRRASRTRDAGAADADEPRGAQQPKLMRDGRLGQADERRQVADAPLAVASARRRSRTRVGSPSSLKTSATASTVAAPSSRAWTSASAPDRARAASRTVGSCRGRRSGARRRERVMTYEYMNNCSYVKAFRRRLARDRSIRCVLTRLFRGTTMQGCCLTVIFHAVRPFFGPVCPARPPEEHA